MSSTHKGTRTRLLEAAVAVLTEGGLGAASARTIAQRAEVNQALVFYHYGTVSELVAAAARAAVDEAVARHHDDLAGANSLVELVAAGRRLNTAERLSGNVSVMSQVLAGGQHDPVLAAAGQYGMACWRTEIAGALRRVLHGHPLAAAVDVDALAGAVCAGFVGIELYEGVDAEAAHGALGELEALARLLDAVGSLGPVVSAAVRHQVRAMTRPQ